LKINSTTNRPLSADAVGNRPESAVAQAYGAGSASGSSSSQVALSSASRKMLALQDGSNDINVERVAAIRAAIASGQLKIDTGRIADSLIARARDRLK
jgi:negative regulator of flagellin synthesis FlgM